MNLFNPDHISIIRKLTITRIWNLILLYTSYKVAGLFKKPIHWGNPFSISIEPTTSCNLGCSQCPSGIRDFSRPTGNLSIETFKLIIDQLYKKMFYLILYFQGEPYRNRNFLDFVKYAKSKKIYTVTSTNAHYLNEANAKATVESGLDKIIVSLDGTDQKTYEKYREGGDLNRVINGLKNLVNFKNELKSKTPFIELQFIVFKHNEHQVDEILKLGKELGVNKVALKSAQVYEFEKGENLITSFEKYSRYRKQKDGTYVIKSKLPNKCLRMWRSCVITWDGKVVPCCFDKDAKYQLGNLQMISFNEIWRSKPYNDFRNQILSNRKEIDICKNCTEGLK